MELLPTRTLLFRRQKLQQINAKAHVTESVQQQRGGTARQHPCPVCAGTNPEPLITTPRESVTSN